MKATTKWTKGFSSVVTNNKNHEVVIDLPSSKGGEDLGATAFELCLMSYSGCVSTIFNMIAQKMRLVFTALEVVAIGHQNNGAKTFTDVDIELNIRSEADNGKIEKCLKTTLDVCPVGVLFKQAGVNINYKIINLQKAL